MNFCIPTGLSAEEKVVWDVTYNALFTDPSMSWLKSMHDASTSVFICMALACVYSMGFIYLMSAFAEYLAKGLVFLIVGGLWMACFIAGYMFANPNSAQTISEVGGVNVNDPKKYLIAAIFFGALALVFTLIVCFRWNDIQMACDVLDATADFFADTKRIILVQVGFFFFTLILIIVWLFGIMGLWSIADVTANPGSDLP